jgi:UDP-N-acetylmuramoylalanine--D-glutamate ligase
MDAPFRSRKVLVVGMGRSGLAVAGLLKKKGAVVTVTDVRSEPELIGEIQFLQEQGIFVEVGGHQEASFLESDLIVVSPGVRLDLLPLQKAKARGTEIIGELEMAFRFLQGRVIAITGTNGKTTTTTLIGEILGRAGYDVQVGGNIGTALSSFVNSSSANTWNVVEVSSFQLELAPTFRPDIAVFLNITPDHLDRYTSFEAYFTAKLNLFRNQKPTDFAVLNHDDLNLRLASEGLRSEVFWFSSREPVPRGAFRQGDELIWREMDIQTPVLRRAEIPLKGEHNVENVAAAIAASVLAQVPIAQMGDSIKGFKGVEHRMEFSGNVCGVQFYNDSKATNVDAALKALKAFDSGIILILGGRDKGGNFRALAPHIEKRVKSLVLLGEASNKIRSQLGNIVPMAQSTSMRQAVEIAFSKASSQDTVLLAPACASFDMFENYEERGREFKKAVQSLAASVPDTHSTLKTSN